MECLYLPEIKQGDKNAVITGDEARHCKALRLNIDDDIFISNGKGYRATGRLINFDKQNYEFEIIEGEINPGELPFHLTLAIGMLDDKSRFEFALEKAVELGVREIIPFKSDFSQNSKLRTRRSSAKLIAAMKQCRRGVLPELHDLTDFNDIFEIRKESYLIACDIDGKKPGQPKDIKDVAMIIGPEGGFSVSEREILKNNSDIWKLSDIRLRSETSAVSGLAVLNSMYGNEK